MEKIYYVIQNQQNGYFFCYQDQFHDSNWTPSIADCLFIEFIRGAESIIHNFDLVNTKIKKITMKIEDIGEWDENPVQYPLGALDGNPEK